MKRPLTYFLLSYVSGILLGRYTSHLIYTALFLLCFTIICFVIYFKKSVLEYAVLPVFFIIGIIFISLALQPKNEIIEQKVNTTLNVIGEVLDSAKTQRGNYKIIIMANVIDDVIINDKIKLQIYLDEASNAFDIKISDNVKVNGELMLFNFTRNPNAFNEFLYMKTRKIDYKMFGTINKRDAGKRTLNSILKDLRNKISSVYDAVLPEKEASIVKAMLLGDKSHIDESITELYRKSGISHILAISGLHISMLAIIIQKIFTKLKIHKKVSSIAIIIFLVLYTLFVGSSVSAVRATLMMSIHLCGNIIYRKQDSITSATVAAFLLLLYQPLFLWDVGFQLSFGAVTGLILLAPKPNKEKTILHRIKDSFLSTLAAVAVTSPLTVYYFYELSIISLVVNIIIIPFLSIILGFSILVGLIGLFSETIALLLSASIYFILKFYEIICNVATIIPLSTIQIGKPNLFIMLTLYILILAVYVNIKKLSINKMLIYYSAALLFLTIAISNISAKKFLAVFLDVGQGDSCVIHTSNNTNILIDGGGNMLTDIGNNTGVNVVYPYLRSKGITKLDMVIATHPDADHVLGIIELFDLIRIDKLIVSDADFTGNELQELIIEKATEHDVEIIKLREKDKINLDKDTYLECIYPNDLSKAEESANNKSITLKMHYKNKSILFTGDIEKEAEYNILQKTDVKTDILKVAHHGSKTSSTIEFIEKAAPKDAIISCKKNNSFGHPSKQTLDNLNNCNANIFITADSGAIIVRYKKNDFLINTMKEFM